MTTTGTDGARPPLAKLIAAFAAVYVIWGSTYLAIRFAIETLPPLLMAGTRFLTAGALLLAFLRLRGVPMPSLRNWRAGLVVGGLLLLGGNGSVVLAERTVPSGVAALLVAMVPAYMVLVEWLRPGGTRPTGRIVLGLVVGFAGMILLVGPAALLGGGGVDPVGALTITIGSLAWAVGSVMSRRMALPENPLAATAIEMMCGGLLLLAAGSLRGEWTGFDPSTFSTTSLLAMGYLVVFGSLVAFTAYIWLLGVTTPARVATYAYVNPIVAVVLGWAMADEQITARMLIAAAVIIAAVAVITTGGGKASDAKAEAEGTEAGGERRAPRGARRRAS